MTQNNDAFFSAASEAVADHTVIKNMRELAERAILLQTQIDQMEDAVKTLRNELNDIRHQRLPDLMSASQVSKFKLLDGTEIKVEDFCSGSLPKEPDKRTKAIGWLVDNDGEGLIKTEVTTTFGRKEHNQAMSVADDLRKQGLDVDVSEGVHPATLQAYAKERMRNGEPIDTETLGLYIGRVAKIKMPATKKEKA